MLRGQAALEYAYDVTESSLRQLVTDYHRDAQKRKDVATHKLARDIYAKYLDAFSDTDHAYQMRFFFAGSFGRSRSEASRPGVRARRSDEPRTRRPENMRGSLHITRSWPGEDGHRGEKGTLTRHEDRRVRRRANGRVESQASTQGTNSGRDLRRAGDPEVELSLSRACDVYFKIADPRTRELPAIKVQGGLCLLLTQSFCCGG